MEDTCPGCVRRGTGACCFFRGQPIPERLRTRPGQPKFSRSCPDCQAGMRHTHEAS